MPTKETAHRMNLKMMAVQIAGDLPGNRRDALFVLERARKILEENVFEDEVESPAADVVRLSLVSSGGDRVS